MAYYYLFSALFYFYQLGKFGDVGDGEAEAEGAKGVNKHGGIFATRNIFNGALEAMERTSKNLNFVVKPGEGVSVFDWAISEVEDVSQALDLPVGHPGKGREATGSGRCGGILDVTGEQEALFEDILTILGIYPDKDFSRDDHPFLDVTGTISPIDQFLLGSHISLHFVGKTLRIVKDLATHQFVMPFHLCNIPCRGIKGGLFGAFLHASGARP